MRTALRSRLAAVLASTSLMLAACGGGGGSGDGSPTAPTPPVIPPVVVVEMTASAANLVVGSSLQLQATVSGASNTAVTWSSSAPDVVAVSAAGQVTALRTGLATITARPAADPSKAATTAVAVALAQGTSIAGGAAVSGVSGAEDSQRLYRITVPVGTPRLEVVTTGGTGDVDLYLRAGQPPAAGSVACASEGDATAERCVVDNPTPGEWFILLIGFEAYGGVTLTATPAPAGPATPAGFTISPAAGALSIVRGSTATLGVSVARTGSFADAITLSVEGLPSGVTATGATIASGSSSASLAFTAGATAAAGTSIVTVRARAAGQADRTAQLSLVVTTTATGGGGTGGGGTGTGSFASVRTINPPGWQASMAFLDVQATNEGVYVTYSPNDDDTHVARFETGGPDAGWITMRHQDGLLSGFAPVSLIAERSDVFSGYWVENTYSCNFARPDSAGMYNVNSGTPEFKWANDLCIEHIVPSADVSESQRLAWAVAKNGDVYREKMEQGAGGGLSAKYVKVASVPSYNVFAAHPTASSLMVGGSGALYEVALNGAVTTRSLAAFGAGFVSTLRFANGTLWIGYAGQILRLGTDGVVRQFNAPQMPLAFTSQFCVQGGAIYTQTGDRIDIATGARRTWIADREMSQMTSQADIQQYMDIFGKIAGGILDCSPSRAAIHVASARGFFEVVPK